MALVEPSPYLDSSSPYRLQTHRRLMMAKEPLEYGEHQSHDGASKKLAEASAPSKVSPFGPDGREGSR